MRCQPGRVSWPTRARSASVMTLRRSMVADTPDPPRRCGLQTSIFAVEMTVFWLVTGVVLLGVEALTLVFFALFIALGMFAAAIASGMGAQDWAQVVCFVGVAGVGILVA